MRRVIFILLVLMLHSVGYGQEKDTSGWMMGYIEGEDTVIHRNIKEVIILPDRVFKNKRQYRRYSRYVQKVKKVYPLAVEARELLIKYEPEYYALETQKERRKLMKRLEKELLDEHKDELKKWSISDGRILLKLINRETERTPYNLIKDFRGGFSAVFWQGIARLFKNNLKAGYDPDEEDKVLEEIITLIELGYL
ncbi:MAG: DUF4294 domain-containing protein [Bacteroidota bacterium]